MGQPWRSQPWVSAFLFSSKGEEEIHQKPQFEGQEWGVIPKAHLAHLRSGWVKARMYAEHLVGRSRAAGPGVQGIVPNPATLSAALQEDPRKSRLQRRSGPESVPHIRLFPWDYSSMEAKTLDPAAMGMWEEMKKREKMSPLLLLTTDFQALFPQSLIHWTRNCFLAPIINMKGVGRGLELWLERELGWRCRFPDGGVSLDVKTKRSMWGLGVN